MGLSYYNIYNNYKSIGTYCQSEIQAYNEVKESGALYDEEEFIGEIKEISNQFSTALVNNNIFGILLGIGILVFPIMFSLNVGDEYKMGTIKHKSVFYTTKNVFVSKVIVMFSFLLSFFIVYGIVGNILLRIFYYIFFKDCELFDSMQWSVYRDCKIILFVFAIVMFYALLTMCISLLFKSSVAGIITTIIINYVVLPVWWSPHNVAFSILNKVLYNNGNALFDFQSAYNKEAMSLGKLGIMWGGFILVATILGVVISKRFKLPT